MEIEQVKPKKPNFLLILYLFAAMILVLFVLALAFVTLDHGHLGLRHRTPHPTSQLRLPAPGAAHSYCESPA